MAGYTAKILLVGFLLTALLPCEKGHAEGLTCIKIVGEKSCRDRHGPPDPNSYCFSGVVCVDQNGTPATGPAGNFDPDTLQCSSGPDEETRFLPQYDKKYTLATSVPFPQMGHHWHCSADCM